MSHCSFFKFNYLFYRFTANSVIPIFKFDFSTFRLRIEKSYSLSHQTVVHVSLAKLGNLVDIFDYTKLFVACLNFFNRLDSSVTDES